MLCPYAASLNNKEKKKETLNSTKRCCCDFRKGQNGLEQFYVGFPKTDIV